MKWKKVNYIGEPCRTRGDFGQCIETGRMDPVRLIDYSIFSHIGACVIDTIYRGTLRTTKVYTRNIDDAIMCAVTVHQNEVDGWDNES